jgi:hypothetical protein
MPSLRRMALVRRVAIEDGLPDPRTAFFRKSESSYSVRAIGHYWLWRFKGTDWSLQEGGSVSNDPT